MPHIPFHPAIGFGDLMAGWFVVPQNPIRDAGTPLVPFLQATAPNRVMRKARLAELMPGGFTVPQNPLRMALNGGMSKVGCGCSSGGCGSGSQTNYTLNGLRGRRGIGQLDTSSVGNFFSSIPDWLQEPSPIFTGVSNWVFYGGLIIGFDVYLNWGRSKGRGGKH